MIRAVLCAAAVVPTLLAACGEDAPVDDGAGESTPPPTQAPPVLTEADSGGEVRLPLGGETNLRLTSDYVWSEPAVRGDAVVLVRVDYLRDPGFSEWVVMAQAPGRAVVSATGEPACAGEEGCPEAPRDFTVTIVVD